MEIVLIKSTDIVAIVMLVTLMKTAPQVSFKNFTCLSKSYKKNNCLDINECQSDPCVYGNCTDLINGYSCNCNAGYTDENCSTSKFKIFTCLFKAYKEE